MARATRGLRRARAHAGNRIGNKGGAAIAEALKTNRTVHTLYLGGARAPPRLSLYGLATVWMRARAAATHGGGAGSVAVCV